MSLGSLINPHTNSPAGGNCSAGRGVNVAHSGRGTPLFSFELTLAAELQGRRISFGWPLHPDYE
jgi:hypothetical protein